MKHLRKYNENLDSSFDINYFNDCFVEFIDNGAETDSGDAFEIANKVLLRKFGNEDSINTSYYEIYIKLPGVSKVNNIWKFKNPDTLDERLKYSEDLVEFYREIENCLEKVRIKYPNVEIRFEVEKGNTIEGSKTTFDVTATITIVQPKSKSITKPMKKGLNTINFSELNDTWDVRPENN
jgi:hypothetical protein